MGPGSRSLRSLGRDDDLSGAGGGMGCRDKPGNESGGALTGPEPLRVQAGGRGRGGGVASRQKTNLPGPLPTPESVAQMPERAEEGRGGKEGGSKCKSQGSPGT